MENYQETKNEMAILAMMRVLDEATERTEPQRSKEFEEFILRMEIIKDMLVNL